MEIKSLESKDRQNLISFWYRTQLNYWLFSYAYFVIRAIAHNLILDHILFYEAMLLNQVQGWDGKQEKTKSSRFLEF